MIGRQLEVSIDSLAAGGDGVGRVDGQVCFVPLAAPGDRLLVRVSAEKRRLLRAAIVEVREPGPARREPRCPLFGECGGCAWQHVAETAQREAKSEVLARAIGASAPEVVPSALAYGYRRVARLHVARSGDGRVALGFARRASGAVVDVPACPVLVPDIDAALRVVREALLPALGDAAEVVLAAGSDGVIAAFRSAGALPPQLYERARALVPDPLLGVVVEIDGVRAVIAGAAELLVEGVDGRPSRVPAGSFGQANAAVNLELARTVGEWLAAGSHGRAIELFAGAGNLTPLVAAATSSTLAVELDEHACRAARENAAARGLRGVTVRQGEALDVYRRHGAGHDLVLLDPPRTGHRELARALARGAHGTVIYVSCDPATLGRDLAELAAGGYRPVRVRGFDMFPQTPHLESAVLLER